MNMHSNSIRKICARSKAWAIIIPSWTPKRRCRITSATWIRIPETRTFIFRWHWSIKSGALDKALALYQKSLELSPDQIASHLAIADLYETQKSTAAALAEYRAAAAIQANNPMVLLRMGNLYYHAQQWDEARKAFKSVQALAPKDPAAFYWLARIEEEQRNWKEAARRRQSLSAEPGSAIFAAGGLLSHHEPRFK